MRSCRRQLTRLSCPWDSPGKNTGVGCHFLLQCLKVKSEREVTQSYLTLSDPMNCSTPGLPITNSWSLLKLMSIKSVMPSNHLILYRPLVLPPLIFPSIGSFPMSQFFTAGGQSIGVSASASVLPKNIQDWFPLDRLVWSPCSPTDSQESSPTKHSSEASILWHSAFFIVQLSHPYMTTGKTITLMRQTFVGKVISPF